MAPHHCSDRHEIRRAARRGLDDRRHLAEVVGAEDAGADDRQHLRIDVALVLGELERLGYVERRPDRDDMRSKRIALTRRGSSAVQAI